MRPHLTRLQLTLCALCCVLFASITWQVAADGPFVAYDERLSGVLRDSPPPPSLAELLADLGNVEVAVPVLLAATVYAVVRGGARRRWQAPAGAALAQVLVALLVSLVKVWLGRPGPPGGTNYYPSGHAATAAVAFGGAALLVSLTLRRGVRLLLCAVAALLTLACSAGLVWRGYHWPLDVAGSWCLSWVVLTGAAACARRAPDT
jgi:undecaprenyl-diphosphatase